MVILGEIKEYSTHCSTTAQWNFITAIKGVGTIGNESGQSERWVTITVMHFAFKYIVLNLTRFLGRQVSRR